LAAPDFTKLSFIETPVRSLLGSGSVTVLLPSKDWAMLVVWSILAGFSEQLVPNSLAKVETIADKK
jgi:hypothetical protein